MKDFQTGFSTPQDASQRNEPGPPAPLVLARQGSFFVNEQMVETSFARGTGAPTPGHISAKGMYVQYQIPLDRSPAAYPIVLVPGASHTTKCYEETPDGRMGWAEYFVRKGIPTYLVDHAGRGRSGFDPSPGNQARLEGKPELVPNFWTFSNEMAWTIFRFGPEPFVPYGNTRFPVSAQEQYFAQVVPNTETSYPEGGKITIDALAKLLDRIGPAVVFVHSQTGAYGIETALARPNLVRALIIIEPRSCKASDADIHGVLRKVPLLTLFGDFFGAGMDDWPGRLAECVQTVERIRAAGGTAENIYLPDRGILGNSHMLMMDDNNLQLADLILNWLARNGNAR